MPHHTGEPPDVATPSESTIYQLPRPELKFWDMIWELELEVIAIAVPVHTVSFAGENDMTGFAFMVTACVVLVSVPVPPQVPARHVITT